MGRSRFDATGAPDQHASQAGPLQAGAAGSGSGQVGARKFRGEVSLRPPSKEGVGTVAFSVAFILILRRKVISVLVTRFDNICNNFIRLTLLAYVAFRSTKSDFEIQTPKVRPEQISTTNPVEKCNKIYMQKRDLFLEASGCVAPYG